MRLRAEIDPAHYPAAVEADGNLRFENGAPVYSGLFKVRAKDDAAATGRRPKKQRRPIPAIASTASSRSTTSGCRSTSSCSRPARSTTPMQQMARVSSSLASSRASRSTLDGAQVRFDEAVGAEEKPGGLTLDERIAALEQALADLPRPAIPGRLDVNLPAIVAGDTTIRDVRLSAEPADGGWTVKSFAATLPGRTTLEAGGKLKTDGEFGFAGFLLLGDRATLRFRGVDLEGRRRRDQAAARRRLPGQGRPDSRAAAVRRPRAGAWRRDFPRPGGKPAAGRRQGLRRSPAVRRRPRPRRPCRLRLAVRQRRGREPLCRPRPRSRGQGRTGERRRAGGRHGGRRGEAARRAARDRPAFDRRIGRRHHQRDRHGQGFPRKSRAEMSMHRSWRSTWRRSSLRRPGASRTIC